MPTVLSIQSWVACGNVGNNAALFPLQRLGCETWSLNTVAFSNHTGHPRWRGEVVRAAEIAGLFDGIAELGVLPRCDAVLSGYLGMPATGVVLLDIVARVKEANPKAIFCCDPVMGDVGRGMYVGDGIPQFFRDRALALADIVTPNRFELEWLSGAPVDGVAAAAAAAERLRRRGPQTVLVTSLEAGADRLSMLAAGREGIFAVEVPRLPLEATGCGDAVAALFLGWRLKGRGVGEALGLAAAGIHAAIEATLAAGGGELALVAAQDELVAPSRRLSVERL